MHEYISRAAARHLSRKWKVESGEGEWQVTSGKKGEKSGRDCGALVSSRVGLKPLRLLPHPGCHLTVLEPEEARVSGSESLELFVPQLEAGFQLNYALVKTRSVEGGGVGFPWCRQEKYLNIF